MASLISPRDGDPVLEDLARMMIERALRAGADYADVRFARVEGANLDLRDRELKEAVSSKDDGVGLRVLFEGAWGFIATNDLLRANLKDSTDKAVRIAKLCSRSVKVPEGLAPVKVETGRVISRPKVDPRDIGLEEKLEVLRDVDRAARSVKGIVAVSASYNDDVALEGFFSSEGASIVHGQPMTSLQARIVARGRGRISSIRMRIGGTRGYEILKANDPMAMAKDFAERTVNLLKGKRPPSGRLPLVSDPDLTGVFVHEALGHACEADAIIGGDSVLEGMLGKRIASEKIDIFDDPTRKGAFGSFIYDDEGVRGRKKQLVKEGVLKCFIQTRTTAHRLGARPNGGARAESYSARPLVRMSNTFMGGGDHVFEELVEDIRFGVFAKGSRGGQVDTAKGSFQFNAQEAFLIEKGEVTAPLRDLSLSGLTLQILNDVEALGKEVSVEDPGYCGKGQWVPVGDGGPHMKVGKVIVGGG
jgi:TldD protein